MKDGKTFAEYMSEDKPVNRWLIIKVGLAGMFCGAALATMVAWMGIL